jgi:hypothetical protein
MNSLPNDASADQSNCPQGYYRRSNGMLVQAPKDNAGGSVTLRAALKAVTASEMREAASKRLDLAIAAVETILMDSEARHSDKLAAATFIRDTAHGKPAQSMEVTAKIGIIEIVMEAARQQKAMIDVTLNQ